MKISTKQIIEDSEWDKLVSETYGRPYEYQQQGGCRYRGLFPFRVPDEVEENDWPNTIPEVVNGEEMGVSFEAWLTRDPGQKILDQDADYQLALWWTRNFYPPFQAVANDLCQKGMLEAGEYVINIDW